MCAQQGALAHRPCCQAWLPSIGSKRTSPRHSAPPAKEVTGDNMSTCLVQEHVARHETEQMYDQTKHSGHRHSDVEPGDASASSHVGSKSASQATRWRVGRDVQQSQGCELTGQCFYVCPARRISPSPLLSYLVTNQAFAQSTQVRVIPHHRPPR
jgi:hypothetical protein